MTTNASIKERAEERTRYEVLLEDLQGHIRVLAEGHAANAQSIKDTKAELEHEIKQVDHRVMVLDVKVNQKIDVVDQKINALDVKVDHKIDALDQKINALDVKVNEKIDVVDARLYKLDVKIDALDTKLSAELSRIATHLGLSGAPHPAERL